jgi:hypothetical protein
VEVRFDGERVYRRQTLWGNTTLHTKITRMTLNLDHEAARSFVLHAPNGTPVYLNKVPGKTPGREYCWQNGQVIDDTGRVI